MSNKDTMKWYILQAYTGTEDKAVRLLKDNITSAKLDDFFGEAIVPYEDVIEIKNGRCKKIQRRFLPGYVLIRMLINDNLLNVIKDTSLIFGFIGGNSDEPASISQKEVDSILSKVKASSDDPKPSVMYEIGGLVRINSGPFADFDAAVKYVNYEKSSMTVTVMVFGRPTLVEISFDSVSRI